MKVLAPVTRRPLIALAIALALGTGVVSLAYAPPAYAISPVDPLCNAPGAVSGLAGNPCGLAGAGSGLASTATSDLVLAPIVASVVGGARFVLQETVHVVGQTTSPQLTSAWFSGTYWRVAEIAAVLTLPFLFAAAVHALVRSDLGLLLRAVLGYLPLALLAVTVAAPVTALLLAASDQLSATVASAAGDQSVRFLEHSTSLLGAVALTFSSPFVVFLVALLTVGGAVLLWIELMVRGAAVYVIVLMLPLAFAAFVWPARRIWAVRSIELLVALVLSKFAIVAVLALGGAALAHASGGSVTALLAGAVLMALAALAPWALLRLIPLTEVASAAAGSIGGGSQAVLRHLQQSDSWASEGNHWAVKTAQMRDAAAGAEDTNGARATKAHADGNLGQERPQADAGNGRIPPSDETTEAADAATGRPAAEATVGRPPPRGEEADGSAPPTAGADPDRGHSSTELLPSGQDRVIDLENQPSPRSEPAVQVGHGGEISDPTPPAQPDDGQP